MQDEFVLGHEGAGTIAQIGENVKENSKVGDRACIFCFAGCGNCERCERGLYPTCSQPGKLFHGVGRDGCLAEYIVIQSRAAVKLNEKVKMEVAATIGCGVITAYNAVRRVANVQKGQNVVIIGLGGVGLNAVQSVMHLGGRCIVVDKKREALDTAVRFGVKDEDVVDTSTTKLEDFVGERGLLIDAVIDFVGHESTVLSAQMVLRAGGTLVLTGLASATVPVSPILMTTKTISIKGSWNGLREDMDECVKLVAEGIITPKVSTGSVESMPEVVKLLDEGKIDGRRILLPDWNESAKV